MILFVFFVTIALVAFAITTAKARSDISQIWSREGPGRIADHLQGRNRTIIGVVVAVLFVFALLEAVIPGFHAGLETMQFVVGDYLNTSPTGVTTFGSGAGISWGLYLSIALGALIGILAGTASACKAYGSTKGIEFGQLV